MIPYGTTDTKIVRIPEGNITVQDDANCVTIENLSYHGTVITINKDCMVTMSVLCIEDSNYSNNKLYFGISVDSCELTTNIESTHIENILTMSKQSGHLCISNRCSLNENKKEYVYRLHTNGVPLEYASLHIITYKEN